MTIYGPYFRSTRRCFNDLDQRLEDERKDRGLSGCWLMWMNEEGKERDKELKIKTDKRWLKGDTTVKVMELKENLKNLVY